MYSIDTLKNKTVSELAEIARVLGSPLTEKDGADALIAFITGGTVAPEPPKKKRGRPSKAELAAREAAAKEAEEAAKAQKEEPAVKVEEAAKVEETPAEEAPKKRRARRSKEEIEAAAEVAAAALAAANQKKEAMEEATPEQAFDNKEQTGNTAPNLLEHLQTEAEEKKSESSQVVEEVWEGDPNDGTDFIIVRDLPIDVYSEKASYGMQESHTPKREYAPREERPQREERTEAKKDEKPQEYNFDDVVTVNGVLEIMPDGFGFLRSSDYNYLSSPDDVFVTTQQVKRNSLKTGDVVECRVRPPHEGEKFFTLTSVTKVNGCDPVRVRDRVAFENLTPLFPNEKFELCGVPSTDNVSVRVVDLFSPIGKGQRALIVAQPKTGKTILLKDIANAISANHPEAYLMMLLIDERPEEVTDMARTVNAEVIASTFDESAEHHVKIAGIVLEKAKRLVECGHDVVIFLDSITRLARAYNTVAPASGKILTGGVDANALQKPKRFFGAARNIEGGGSLTIVATALIDTGSKMDEVIFEEFKGTGNMELVLERSLSNKRIFPAVNLIQSSTRRDDLLHDRTTQDRMWILRKHIADMTSLEAMNLIHDSLAAAKSTGEFLISMNS